MNHNHVYINDRIIERINMPISMIDKNIDSKILKFIVNKIGDKCIEAGHIKSSDIKIIGRTSGLLDVSHFTGEIIFDVECQINVFNPPEGSILFCKVTNKNKMGIVAEIAIENPSPIRILLAREHHIDNEKFHDLAINDEICVEVIAKRYEYNDNKIQAIGVLSTEEELLKQNSSFKSIFKYKVKPQTSQHKTISSEEDEQKDPWAHAAKSPSVQSEFIPSSPGFQVTPEEQPVSPSYQPQSPGYDPSMAMSNLDAKSPTYIPKTEGSFSESPTFIPPKFSPPGVTEEGSSKQPKSK